MVFEIENILGKKFKCEDCGRVHRIDIKGIEYGNLEEIGSFIRKKFKNDKKKVLLLCDNIIWEIYGEKIKRELRDFITTSCVLTPKNENRVTARYEYLEEIYKNLDGKNLILTVGSGTITDLGKLAGYIEKIPVISFPTAPSMNGYTSPVSAYIKDGIKITVPVKPPEYVYIDKMVISQAPIELIKSGFADSLAKGFANADWKISSILTNENYCSLPLKIVNKAEKKYINKGEKILKRDVKTIQNLMEGLNFGGISMIIAGSSSPASGGEHLISHFLDMYTSQKKMEPFDYHGLQVGTGVFFSSLIYEKLRKIERFDIEKRLLERKIDYDKKLEKLVNLFFLSKEHLEKIFKNKLKLLKEIKRKLPENWEKIKKDCFSIVNSSEKIKKILENARCPYHLKQICDNKNLIYDTLELSRFIRERITILDIADEIGILYEVIENYMEK
ncbi:MAG: iron-containing alcohol dehydrogenase [Candidatus Omnitrophica bacterium]|nr:iron-containing alcohol dehydrogenase [Candidatus Omnitrophota bacterium]